MTVLVFGSINMDLVVQVPRLPQTGETIIGKNFLTAFGGKGANQAVALAKLGIPVEMVGQVGGDDFGQALIQGLQRENVGTDAVGINPQIHSGVASIVVSDAGENTIACADGANGTVGMEELQRFKALLPEAKLVLLELGIPLSIVLAAAQMAHEQNIPVILDPAPASPNLPEKLYPLIEILTPNEVEASQLVGFSVHDPQSAHQAALVLRQRGVSTVIVTLGAQGVFYSSPTETILLPALSTKVVDTVAAGDAFNGGLAAALMSEKSLQDSVRWGIVVATLAISKQGAQPSLPNWESFQKLLKTQGWT